MRTLKILVLLLLAPCLSRADEHLISNYYESFAKTQNWEYLWNQRGDIGNPANYVKLAKLNKRGSFYVVDNSTGKWEAGLPMLYPEGGHVGMSAVEDSAGIARYAITSYSFTDASKGIVWIDGAVQFPASDLELKHVLKVFLNGNCLFSKEILGGFKGALGLQVKVGRVKKGDRLYVATGAINVKKLTRANAWFRLNFDISDYAAHETPAPTANFYYQESTDSVPQMKARGKAFSEKFEKQCEFNLRNRPDIIFLGDSITEYYSQSDSWKDINDAYNVSNCGIGWDATQNVIWRLENGGFEKLNPKLVVLLIGTNNIGIYGHDEQEVLAGIKTILGKINEKMPNSRILLLGILPRGHSMNDEINKNLICKINKELSSFADNKKIFYTEIMLSDKDGNIPASVSDGLHLKNNGYRIITDHLLSEFKNILTSGKTEDNDKKRREKTWVIF